MKITKLETVIVDISKSEVKTLKRTFYSGDKDSAKIIFLLKSGGQDIDLIDNQLSAEVEIKTKDGLYFTYDPYIEGNKVEVILETDNLLHPGRAVGELTIKDSSSVISAFSFSFDIKLSVGDDIIRSIPATENIVKIIEKTLKEMYVSGGSGESAYQIAVRNGFVGTEVEWLDSLKVISQGGGLSTMPYYESELKKYNISPSDYPFANFMSDYLQMAVESVNKVDSLSNDVDTLKNSGGVVSLLNGRTALVIGDSLSEYNSRTTKNYQNFIADRTGMIVNNSSFSGTSYQSRINAANDIYVQPDLIIIMLGTNDWSGVSGKQPLGTAAHEIGTVSGAIYAMLKQLINKFPLTPIYTITPPPRADCNPTHEVKNEEGYSLGELADMIVEISRQFSVPCYDLYHKSNLNVWNRGANETYFKPDGGTADGLHLNYEGHKLISYKIQSFLEANAPSTHIEYTPPAFNPEIVENGDGTFTAKTLPYAIVWDQNSFRVNVDKTKLDIEGRVILKVEYEGYSILNAQGTLDNSPYWYTVQSFPSGDFYNNTPIVEPFVSGLELISVDGELKSYMPIPMRITFR